MKAMLDRWGSGFNQHLKGKAMGVFIEDFLALLSENSRRNIESDIVDLRGMVGKEKRFRLKAMLMVAVAYQYGYDAHKAGKEVDMFQMVQAAARRVHETEGSGLG